MPGSVYHTPVLLKETASFLITNPRGIYVDGTVGGGGHAEYILKNYSQIDRYIAIDQDQQALQVAEKRLQNYRQISFVHTNFSQIERVLQDLKITSVDGIFVDLGVSGYQIESPQRGFSYLQSCPLDMRMDRQDQLTAAQILNNWSEKELAHIFFEYGEEKKARQIAYRVVQYRNQELLTRSDHLKKAIDRVVGRRYAIKSYARIFQALRITVNRELDQLKLFLEKAIYVLKSGGRLVIISYHSLEDRIVKNFLKTQADPCTCPPDFPTCVCGKKAVLRILTRKPVKAGPQEIAINVRARSALLRAGEKL